MDFVIDFYTVSVIIFALFLVAIFYKDRKNVERQSILFLRKTQRGKKSIIKLAQAFPRFWKIVGTIGVIIGFGASLFIVFALTSNAITIFTTETVTSGVALVLPSPISTPSASPGILLIPFWYWIISIGLLILVHEGFHGIMSAMEKIKIKSLGWGALLILPLAFVEPDEQELSKRKSMTQLRVYAAGSFANFLLAGLCILILTFGMVGFYSNNGVGYQAVIEDYPAHLTNLTGVIVNINGIEITNMEDLDNTLSQIGANQTVQIITRTADDSESDYILTTVEKPSPMFTPSLIDNIVIGFESISPNTIEFAKSLGDSKEDWLSLQLELGYWNYIKENYPYLENKADNYITQTNEKLEDITTPGFIGILNVYNIVEINSEIIYFEPVIIFVNGLLFFLFLINFGVGMANLLPIKPLDGGRMWYILLQKYTPNRADKIIKILSWATLILILINFIVPILMSLF